MQKKKNTFTTRIQTLLTLQCADRFHNAERTDFRVGSLVADIAALVSAGTEPTSRNACLLVASALHDKFLNTLAVT